MRRSLLAACSFVVAAVLIVSVSAQPPGGGEDKKDKKAKEGKGPPPKFTPGMILPPGLRDELKLTAEQEKAIAALEKEVKEKLDKILTEQQKKAMQDFRPRPPMGGPPETAPMPKEPKQDAPSAKADGGIQWFATLDAGLAEAKRTNKPILFLSAAPHCGGIPGMW